MMLNIVKTHNRFGDKLTQRIAQDRTIDMGVENFITNIRDNIDPTGNHKYTIWIIRIYLNGGIRFYEDMSRVHHALAVFDKNKRQMSIKDINQLKTLSALEDQVESITPEISGKEEKRQLSAGMQQQTTVVYKGPEGVIVVPKTEAASCFWGKGTRWCTAATASTNWFSRYNRNGPLYIIIPKDGTKWQFQLESGQLMDTKDAGVNFDDFKQTYPWVFEKLKFSDETQLAAVQQYGMAIRYIDNPSEVVQLAAVQQYGMAIRYIDNPSEVVKLAAVQQNGYAIVYIDNPPEELNLAAVQQNGYAIAYIDNPPEELNLVAVQQNGHAIKYIKNPSEAVQLAAVQQNGWVIKFVKNPSEDIQLSAVQQDGYAIQFIGNPSEALKLAAVRQDGYAIKYIKNPSDSVKLAAVQQYGMAIQFIGNPSEAVQLAAVQQNGRVIKFIKNPADELKLAAKG